MFLSLFFPEMGRNTSIPKRLLPKGTFVFKSPGSEKNMELDCGEQKFRVRKGNELALGGEGFWERFSKECRTGSLKSSCAMENDILLHILQPGRYRSRISITPRHTREGEQLKTVGLSLSKNLNIPLHVIMMTSVQCRPKGHSSNTFQISWFLYDPRLPLPPPKHKSQFLIR